MIILDPDPVFEPADCQMIGLHNNRISGLVLCRDAYLEVLRSITPVVSSSMEEAKKRECKIHLFAGAMSKRTLDQIGPRPGKNIWCLVIESTALPPQSLETAASVDQVWVPTQFCYDVCAKNGIPKEKLKLVPYYLPVPTRPRSLAHRHEPYTVLVSWDGMSSMNRKHVIGAVQAFKRAWPRTLNVRLKLHTRELPRESLARLLEAMAGDARIALDRSFKETIDEIFDGVHCLFHPHRAEGYGRHLVEAMQRRLPTIATAYSGNMDWMTDANAFLVNYQMVETAQKEFQYPQGGWWAEPDIDHAATLLRKCRDDYAQLTPMLDQAEADAMQISSFERSRDAMLKALSEL